MFGATWQTSKGFFFGGGINWSAKAEDREDVGVDSDDNFGTKFGWQFRIGYHPGVAGIPVAAAAASAAASRRRPRRSTRSPSTRSAIRARSKSAARPR